MRLGKFAQTDIFLTCRGWSHGLGGYKQGVKECDRIADTDGFPDGIVENRQHADHALQRVDRHFFFAEQRLLVQQCLHVVIHGSDSCVFDFLRNDELVLPAVDQIVILNNGVFALHHASQCGNDPVDRVHAEKRVCRRLNAPFERSTVADLRRVQTRLDPFPLLALVPSFARHAVQIITVFGHDRIIILYIQRIVKILGVKT